MDLDSSAVEMYNFDVVRKGYDRMQVTEFLKRVSGSMSRLDERRKIAEVRAEQLDRELRDVRTRAEATIQETVAARARLIRSSLSANGDPEHEPELATSVEMSNIEAQQIIEKANIHATAIQAEAEAVLKGALSTSAKINDDRQELLGSVEAERLGLIAAAAAEAEEIKAAAWEQAELSRAKGAARAQEIRSTAESEAQEIMTRARRRATELVAVTEPRTVERPSEPTRPAPFQPSRSTSSLGDGVAEEEPAASMSPIEEESERITVDLREESPLPGTAPTVRASRTSRYKSRSANLPRLGDDASSVIGSLDSLRSKD